MKLLLDANISHKLVERLADLYPDSSHVRAVGLHAVGDREVWEFARSEGFVIVSKDEDFHQLAFLHGPPPNLCGSGSATARPKTSSRPFGAVRIGSRTSLQTRRKPS